jgi:hypothetical protein
LDGDHQLQSAICIPLEKKKYWYGTKKILKKLINQVARIGGTVGRRKRINMIKKAAELEIKVLNPGLTLEQEDELEESEDD